MSAYDVFLGCVIPARLPYLEASSRKIFEKLGIALNDVDGFSCCPDPTGVEQVSHEGWLALGARNLSLSRMNGGIISFCSGCVETLKGVNHAIQNDTHAREEVNHLLKEIGRSYDGSTKVTHFAKALHDNLEKVKRATVKPLTGYKIAVHYGCHYLRPSEIIQGDDPFHPVTVDDIVRAIGAETIPYEHKMDCCGNPVSKTDDDLSLLLVKRKFEAIEKSGANCVVVVCPACYQQFDFKQRDLNKAFGSKFDIPVFYLSEVVALAFGISDDDIGLKFHRVKPNKKPFYTAWEAVKGAPVMETINTKRERLMKATAPEGLIQSKSSEEIAKLKAQTKLVPEPKPVAEVKPAPESKPVADEKPVPEVKPSLEAKPALGPMPETEIKPTADEKPAVEKKPEGEDAPSENNES